MSCVWCQVSDNRCQMSPVNPQSVRARKLTQYYHCSLFKDVSLAMLNKQLFSSSTTNDALSLVDYKAQLLLISFHKC